MSSKQTSSEERQRYLEGHRKNPLTTTDTGGRILSASQVPWFTLLPPDGFGVLTTTGRKTVRPAANVCGQYATASGCTSCP